MMSTNTRSVGKLIYDRRMELQLTQRDVADYVGVSEATVSRWESGHIDNMRRDRIAKLAEVLQVSPLAIMGIDVEPPIPSPAAEVMMSGEARTIAEAYDCADHQTRRIVNTALQPYIPKEKAALDVSPSSGAACVNK